MVANGRIGGDSIGARRFAAVLLILLISVSTACNGDQASVSGEVVLYTSMPDDVVSRLEGVIEQRFPDLEGEYWVGPLGSEGISLNVVRGRTADIEERVANELDGSGIKADIIWLAEPSSYEAYKDMGLLARYDHPDDAPIPPDYVDDDGRYVAGRIISMVVAWNTAHLPEGLSDWSDLREVEQVAFPAPESGAARATIVALLDHYGPDFFTALAEAGMTSVPSNGAARDGVSDGTFEAVAVLDYMARDAKAGGAPVDFTYPSSGTLMIPSPIAITTDASNPEAAEAVVDFILSRSGQQIMVEIGNFYPVRNDVAPPQGAPEPHTIAAFDIDWQKLPGELEGIMALWERLHGSPEGSG